MAKSNLILPIISLLFFLITQLSNARTLKTPTHNHNHNHHQNHPNFKFLMQNVLNLTQINTTPNPKPPKIPFPKPRGYFPPKKGIPLPPSFEFFSSTQNYNYNLGTISFIPKAAPQELEVGSVRQIDEHLFEGTTTLIVGKAQGMFVGSSENMVALTLSFFGNNNKYNYKDGLRLFGVYKRSKIEEEESHIAVIGGIGKYEGANGYAVVKPIDYADDHGEFTNKLLLFHVYLS